MANTLAQSALDDSEASSMTKEPIISPTLPFWTRLTFGIRLWIFKLSVSFALRALYTIKRANFKKIAPTYTKSYPVRPTLQNRIFIPTSHQPGAKLPLYLDIHGGGFALCDPQTDDRFCHTLANTHNILVVSLNYRKAPSAPFPIPVHDAAALAQAVLNDTSLPIDHTRIAIGGFSAGGNLALAISTLPSLLPHVSAVIPVYPVVDFTSQFIGPYIRHPKTGAPDMLESSSALFNWGYIPAGTNRRDLLLSPIYASRAELPKNLFFIGAEYDYLCHEARVMAERLAGLDRKEGEELGAQWEREKEGTSIKWWMAGGMTHGYTHTSASGEEEVARKARTEETDREIAAWLRRVWKL